MPLPDDFYDTLDDLIDKSAEAMKKKARDTYVFNRLERLCDGAMPMVLPKALLCALLQREISQWQLNGESPYQRELTLYL